MSYTLRCDNEACGVELESGSGRASWIPKRQIYCQRCQTYVDMVETELEKQQTLGVIKLGEELKAERKRLMHEIFPPSISTDKTPRKGLTTGWVVQQPGSDS